MHGFARSGSGRLRSLADGCAQRFQCGAFRHTAARRCTPSHYPIGIRSMYALILPHPAALQTDAKPATVCAISFFVVFSLGSEELALILDGPQTLLCSAAAKVAPGDTVVSFSIAVPHPGVRNFVSKFRCLKYRSRMYRS